ncbi:SAV_6107 family HEPN domain-containing protein [Verrucosispora sp. TAA-831]|uniref:SAV_6107 family HEPN domain-containing protein n=1 Tax=Verrucosispora sp. TAA-831 TaxID=3422227 RepID=UPI003D6EF3C5
MTDQTAVPAHLLPHRTPAQLLTMARQGLAEAAATEAVGLRYAAAHMAALRAAAAVLASRARPPAVTNRQERRRVPGVWVQLAQVAPELAEWATHFATTASTRAAAETGIPEVVTGQDADDMLRTAGEFVGLVDRELGGLPIVPWVAPGYLIGRTDAGEAVTR